MADSSARPATPPEDLPEEVRRLIEASAPIWEAHSREAARLQVSSIDVFFLSFLKRLQRFGYFTLGPITIDVHVIEDIVERTAVPAGPDPPFGEDMTRFSHLLAEEVHRSGRKRLDDLHVLLALMKCGMGLPGRVFGELGVTPEQIEQYVRTGEVAQPAEERLYSPEEAAEYLGVHVQTVRAWIRSGRLKASRLAGQRALRIKASDLQSVLEPVDPSEL
ncbi:MAG: helix-turn-helix domain-containing protein [Hyphomicrobiales bacterium]